MASSANSSRSSRECTSARRSRRAPSTTKNSGTKNPSPRPMSWSATPSGLAEQRNHHTRRETGEERAGVEPFRDPREREQHRGARAAGRAPSRRWCDSSRSASTGARPTRRWPTSPTAAAPTTTSTAPVERAAEAAGRQHERNGEDRDDVGERDPRDRHEHRFVVCRASAMIGSTIAAELDATSTASTAGRCSPVTAASERRDDDRAARLVMPNTTRPRRAAARRRCVAQREVRRHDEHQAARSRCRPGTRAWVAVATIVRVPVRPKTTPAAISPITTGGASARRQAARAAGPSSPMATTSARVP